MRSRLVVLGLAVVLGGFVAAPAHAQSTQVTGPLCFSTVPFLDILVWFINADGATANSVFFDGNGKTSQAIGRRTSACFSIRPEQP